MSSSRRLAVDLRREGGTAAGSSPPRAEGGGAGDLTTGVLATEEPVERADDLRDGADAQSKRTASI